MPIFSPTTLGQPKTSIAGQQQGLFGGNSAMGAPGSSQFGASVPSDPIGNGFGNGDNQNVGPANPSYGIQNFASPYSSNSGSSSPYTFSSNQGVAPTLHDYTQSSIAPTLNNNLFAGFQGALGGAVNDLNAAYASQSNINADNGFRRDMLNGILGTINGIGSGTGFSGFYDRNSGQFAKLPGGSSGGTGAGAGAGAGGGAQSLPYAQAVNNPMPFGSGRQGDIKAQELTTQMNAANSAIAKSQNEQYAASMGMTPGEYIFKVTNGMMGGSPNPSPATPPTSTVASAAGGSVSPSGGGSVGGGAPPPGNPNGGPGMAEYTTGITANPGALKSVMPLASSLASAPINTGNEIKDASRLNTGSALASSMDRDLGEQIGRSDLAMQESRAQEGLQLANWLRSLQDDQVRNEVALKGPLYGSLAQMLRGLS